MNRIHHNTKFAFFCIFAAWLVPLAICHYWSVSNGNNGFSPIVFGIDDGIKYYDQALDVLSGSQDAQYLYSAIIAGLMKATGIESVLFYKFVNLIVTFLSLLLLYRLFLDLTAEALPPDSASNAFEKIRWSLLICAAVYPSYVLFSFSWTLLRDGWIFFLFLLCLHLLKPLITSKPGSRFWCSLVFFISCLSALYFFRFYIAVSICISVLLFLGFRIVSERGLSVVSNARLAIVVLGCIVFSFLGVYAKIGGKFYKYVTYRNNYATKDAGSNLGLTIGGKHARRIALIASPAPPQPSGAIVTLGVKDSNSETSEYRFLIKRASEQGSKWEIVQDYSPKASYEWDTSTYAGKCEAMVYVRTVGSNSLFDSKDRVAFELTGAAARADGPLSPAPLSVALSKNLEGAIPSGRTVLLTATTDRDRSLYDFSFLIREKTERSARWIIARDYSPSATYTWNTTGHSGEYQLHVWVRRTGSPYLYEAYDWTPIMVQAAPTASNGRRFSVALSSIVKYMGGYAYSFLSNVFGPLPHQVKHLKMLPALFEGVAIFTGFVYILLNIRRLNQWGYFLAIQSMVWFAMISFFNDNIGTALRLRIPGVLLLMVLFFGLRWEKTLASSAKRA